MEILDGVEWDLEPGRREMNSHRLGENSRALKPIALASPAHADAQGAAQTKTWLNASPSLGIRRMWARRVPSGENTHASDFGAVASSERGVRRAVLPVATSVTHTLLSIAKAIKALKGPLSVNLMDAISGMKTELVPIPELAKMGVGRVSIPVASCMVAHKALTDFFKALKASPTGTLPGQTQWVSSFEGFTDFVGLKDYKKLEDKYPPKQRLEEKYKGTAKIVG
jgi:hypothetical protein